MTRPVQTTDSEKKGAYSYDEVPYPNNPFPQSHPNRLATVATLFGMSPQPIHDCSLLELGCGRGANLIAMAEQLPKSNFIGIELSEVQIGEARRCVEQIKLPNIELKHMNILDVSLTLGQFDYIIAHGVFSWVPREVQDKIFDICATNLSDQGVAYVSYNTYPGWNIRGMIRDMMCYHTNRFSEPSLRIQQARALLDFLTQNTSEKSSFGMLLKSELEILRNHQDGYLFHEHLEDVNDPVYFYEFAERAQAKGLQYLGEADISVMYTGHLPADIVQTLERVASDLVQMEQYLDFLRNRMFRQTLLCHRGVEIDRELRPSDLTTLFIASPMTPTDNQANLSSPGPMIFRNPAKENGLTVHHPMMKSALCCLGEIYPDRLRFDELSQQARMRVDARSVISATQKEHETFEFGKALLKFYINDIVEFHSQAACWSTEVPALPMASKLACYQAEQGKLVTTLRHQRRMLSDLEWHILRQLDGTRDFPMLLEHLTKLVDDQVLLFQPKSGGMTGEQRRQQLSDTLQRTLEELTRSALLHKN